MSFKRYLDLLELSRYDVSEEHAQKMARIIQQGFHNGVSVPAMRIALDEYVKEIK